MTSRKKLTQPLGLFLFLLTLGLMLGGCGESGLDPVDQAATGSDDYTQLEFSQEFGGLTFSDEPEAFGDASLQTLMFLEDGEEAADPVAEDPEVMAWQGMGQTPPDSCDGTGPRFTFLRLRWGMIHGPEDSLIYEPGDCDPLDWTGEIHTDRGIVVVRRVLAFERPYDHLIFPRVNRQTVAFTSHTGCHYDGLVLQIIERPADLNGGNTEPNQLHINTGPYAGVYNVADLAEIDELIEVDALGNTIQLTGFSMSDISYCPKGFLSGRYSLLPPDDGGDPALGGPLQLGTFAGLWVNLNGRILGFLQGGYGLAEDGSRVFVGKYINRLGEVKGLMRGAWEPGGADSDLGSFLGHWEGANGQHEGVLGGQAHPVEGAPGGFFEGRWTANCDDEAEGLIL